jgi:ubiquinone/menaquinone biosynthesis C-methylase UbiE
MTDSKALSKARYNQFAQGYVDSPNHAKGSELDDLLSIVQPQSDWQALDVATGGGHTALKFAPWVAHVVASDISPKMLQAAQAFVASQKPPITNISFREADAENLPFADGEFDLVTCRIAPHHFPNVARFVHEAARVLRSGGTLLVQDQVVPLDEATRTYVDDFERFRDPSHHRVYALNEWQAMFESAGIAVYHTHQIVKRHGLVRWAERQGNDQDVIDELERRLREAPLPAAAWLMARDLGTPDASFVNHHLIIAGRKV